MNLICVFLPSAIFSQTISEAIQSSHENAGTLSETAAETESAVIPNDENAAIAGNDDLFAIQTGYFLSESNANRQMEQLKSQGLDPYIFKSTNSKGKEVFSVRLGQYTSYKDATKAVTGFQKTITTPMIVTRYDSMQTGDAAKSADAAVIASPDMPQNETSQVPAAADPIENNAETPAPEPQPVVPDKPLTMTEMQQKIQQLEQSMQRMKGEADIRSQLQITEEEAAAEEEDILEAAGQEYTLTQAGTVKFTYGLSYGYSGYDAIREGTRVEDVADHTINNSFGMSYGLKDNLTLGTAIPFVYKYHKVGTVDSMEATDLGDLSLSWQFQPIKTSADLPSIIVNGSFGVPVGKNPYDIQPGTELSTSSGIYDANLGVSLSQVTDPVVAFSSFSVSYPFATQSIDQKRTEGVLDEVDPGMGLGAAVGMGYALSYKLNLNMSFSYSYSFSTTYKYQDAPDAKSGNSTGASISIGTGYKFSRNQNLNFNIGIPLTDTRSFTLSFSTPIDFVL